MKYRKHYKRKTIENYEPCVICGKMTDVRADTKIDERNCYIKGCGQLCKECYVEIYLYDIY